MGQVNHDDYTGSQTIGISRVVMHPDYTEGRNGNDFAVLYLSEDIVMGPRISAACLPTELPSDGSTCIVSGWGDLECKYHAIA